MTDDSDLYEPYDRLVTIEVAGRRVSVPEGNRLLRCFQYLSLRSISYGDFCWNGECTNCQFWYREPGDDERDPDRTALSCRFDVREGMIITRLSPGIRLEGFDDAAPPAPAATAADATAGQHDPAPPAPEG